MAEQPPMLPVLLDPHQLPPKPTQHFFPTAIASPAPQPLVRNGVPVVMMLFPKNQRNFPKKYVLSPPLARAATLSHLR